MNGIPSIGVAVAGAFSLLAATTASAASFTVTYTGTVSEGYDQTGQFGAADSDLAGLPFKVVYTVDDTTPGAFTGSGPNISDIYGGYEYGVGVGDPVWAMLTIGDATVTIGLGYFGEAFQNDGFGSTSGYDQIFHQATKYSYDTGYASGLMTVYNSVYTSDHDVVSTSDYRHALDYPVQTGDGVFGMYQNYQYDQFSGLSYYNYADLAATSVSISGVAEPATWTVMVAGLGLLGAAFRRRRTTAFLA